MMIPKKTKTTFLFPVEYPAAAILTDSPFTTKLACVHQNQNEIFLYELTRVKPDRFFNTKKNRMQMQKGKA